MDLIERITKDPLILAGKPCVRGMRISVELVMDYLNGGVWTEEDILMGIPGANSGGYRGLPALCSHRRASVQHYLGRV